MASVNFQELLKKPVTSAVKPPTKPAGTYMATIMAFNFDESSKKKTPYVRFQLGNVQPGPDINPDDLVSAAGEPIDLSKWKPGRDYYLTDDAYYRLRELIQSCGIAVEGRDFSETIPELRGKQVQMTVIQKPSDNGEELYNEVTDLAGVSE